MQAIDKAIRIRTIFFLIFFILHFSRGFSRAGGIGIPTASSQAKTWTALSLQFDSLQPDIDSSNSTLRGESREERILLRAGYSPMRFVDVYLRLGAAAQETPSRTFNGSYGLAYGLGAKWTFYRKEDLALGLGLQILEYVSRDGDASPSRLRWDEVELFTGGVLEGFERMTPYFGFLFSQGRGAFKGGSTFHLKHFFDLFIGADFYVYDRFSFLAEARVLHENGLTFALVYDL